MSEAEPPSRSLIYSIPGFALGLGFVLIYGFMLLHKPYTVELTAL